MKYMGSKNRIAKEILPIILKDRKPGQWYVEPFVGGANMIDKVEGLRLANDFNYYLVCLWRALLKGWIPPDYVEEETHGAVRSNPANFDPHFVAFVRLGCSFGADWNGGFARNVRKDSPNAEELNRGRKSYCRQSKNNMLKQVPNLKGVQFENESYKSLYIPDNSIIYCDPPYSGTSGYAVDFDSAEFWQWCRDKNLEGHSVYISEYKAPPDFDCVWSKDQITSFSTSENLKATEKLFIFNDLY